MRRFLIGCLCSIWGVVLGPGLARAEEAPVSAVWDVTGGTDLASQRMTWLKNDVLDALERWHVDRIPRDKLEERWRLAQTERKWSSIASGVKGADVSVGLTDLASSLIGLRSLARPVSALAPANPLMPRTPAERLASRWPVERVDAQSQNALPLFLHRLPGAPQLVPASEARVQAQLAANAYVGLGVTASGQDGYLSFPTILPGGSAEHAKLPPGVLVLEIDGWSTYQQSISEAVERIRGPVGTWVALRIKDDQGERDVRIRRDFVRFVTVHGWDERPPGVRGATHARAALPRDIAYLRCQQLGGSTVHELRQVEAKIREGRQRGVILDLRTPERTGDVRFARLIADALTDGGVLWRERDRDGQTREVLSDRECLFRGLPMVVLFSSSGETATLALAAALRDSGRATVIEERTHDHSDQGHVVQSFDQDERPQTEPYRYESVSLAEGRWTLRVPTQRIQRADTTAAWPLVGDAVWHTVEAVRTGLVEERVLTARRQAVQPLDEQVLAKNPPLPEALHSLGALGLAIQQLTQQLERGSTP